jgi:hypothetical protein
MLQCPICFYEHDDDYYYDLDAEWKEWEDRILERAEQIKKEREVG